MRFHSYDLTLTGELNGTNNTVLRNGQYKAHITMLRYRRRSLQENTA
jgi:hypothetical protein